MRVIAGTYRSRRLDAPRGDSTRPTSDRLRETLFNVLAPRIAGAQFADLYAGSGAVGIEALSRGAAFVSFAENDRAAVTALRRNLSALGIAKDFALEDRGTVALLRSLGERSRALDIVFLDPSYDDADAYTETLERLAREHEVLLAPEALVIAEHRKQSPPPETVGVLERMRLLRQGDASLSFYQVRTDRAAPLLTPD